MHSPVPTAFCHPECIGHVAGLSERVRQITEVVEQLVEENRHLRQHAGLSTCDTIDLSAVKLAKVSFATACCCSQLQNRNFDQLHMQSSASTMTSVVAYNSVVALHCTGDFSYCSLRPVIEASFAHGVAQ